MHFVSWWVREGEKEEADIDFRLTGPEPDMSVCMKLLTEDNARREVTYLCRLIER
jgi:hypothetical protein